MFQIACAPIFEQMYWHATSNANLLKDVHGRVSREAMRTMCEPFFEQMTSAVQQSLQYTRANEAHDKFQMQNMGHNMANSYVGGAFSWDEASTDADEISAFPSFLSGPSSDADEMESSRSKSRGIDSLGLLGDFDHECDTEKSVMCCRHWKSKGWCRLESKCKFLHLEHKRGVGLKVTSGSDLDGAMAAATSTRHKKRGGKNRANKDQHAQLSVSEQAAQEYRL
jgi:hypothetical protein